MVGRAKYLHRDPMPEKHPEFAQDQGFERRRQTILRAAIRLFNRDGYHQTSIKDLAAELGISGPSVYYYFKDKKDLLYHCHAHSLENGLSIARDAAAQPGRGLQKLEYYIRRQFNALVEQDGATWVFSDLSALKPEQRQEMKRGSRDMDAIIRSFIEQGQADGSLTVENGRVAEFFLLGAMNWVPRWYRPDSGLTGDELAETFLQLTFDGLRPR